MAASAATASSSPGLCPNYAVICSFLERYGALLDLPELTFPQLERYLQDTSSVPKLLVDLHVKLLRKIGKSVTADRWEKYLVKVCQEFNTTWAWELEQKGYKELPTECKTGILKYLCECQFDDNVKFKTAINEEDPDKMRLQPIGRDKDGQMYWFQLDQDDNVRVYLEEQDDLDGSSWKCIVKDRNDLAEVVALLKTQIDPALLKKDQETKPDGEEGKEKTEDGEVKKIEDSSDEDNKDSNKDVGPLSPKSENKEKVTQKDNMKSETSEAKSSLNGTIEGKTEAELNSEKPTDLGIGSKAHNIKEEPMEVSNTKTSTATSEPSSETPCISVKAEKGEEARKNSAEEIQQALKNDQQAKIPLKKRGMKFSEDFEKHSGIIVPNPSVSQVKEAPKADSAPEQTKKAQNVNDHVNGEVQPSSEKGFQSNLCKSPKEQTVEPDADKSVEKRENDSPSTDKDDMKDKKDEACSAEKVTEGVASNQANSCKKNLDVQVEKESTTSKEKKETHESPPPLPKDVNNEPEKSSNNEEHEQIKESKPAASKESCTVDKTLKETDKTSTAGESEKVTSKEVESKDSEEKPASVDPSESNQTEETKKSENVTDMKQAEMGDAKETATSETKLDKSVAKEKPEVIKTANKYHAKKSADAVSPSVIKKTEILKDSDNTETQEATETPKVIENADKPVIGEKSQGTSNAEESAESSVIKKLDKSCKPVEKHDNVKDAEMKPEQASAASETNTEKTKKTEKPEDVKKTVNCEDNTIHSVSKISDSTPRAMGVEAVAVKPDLTKPQEDDKTEINSVACKMTEEASEGKDKPSSAVEKTNVSKETDKKPERPDAEQEKWSEERPKKFETECPSSENKKDAQKENKKDTVKENKKETIKENKKDTVKENKKDTDSANKKDTVKEKLKNDSEKPQCQDKENKEESDNANKKDTVNENKKDTVKENKKDTVKENKKDTVKEKLKNDSEKPQCQDKENKEESDNANKKDTVDENKKDTVDENKKDTVDENKKDTVKENKKDTVKENKKDTDSANKKDTVKEKLKNDSEKPQCQDKEKKEDSTTDTQTKTDESKEEKHANKESKTSTKIKESGHQKVSEEPDSKSSTETEKARPPSKELDTKKPADEESKSKSEEEDSAANKGVANGGEAPSELYRRKIKPRAHRRKAELQREERQADSESDTNTGRSLRRSPRISRPTPKVVEIHDRKLEKSQATPPAEKCEDNEGEKEKDEEEEEEKEEVVKAVQKKPREKKADQEGQPKPKGRKRRKVRWSNTRTRRKKKGSEDDDDSEEESSEEEEESEEEDDSDEDYKVERGRKRRNRNRERRSSDSSTSSDDDLPPNDDPCKHCGLPNHPELILLCDSCDSGYHTACLRPPLMIIPDGEWFCPPCQHKLLCDKLDEQLQNLDAALKKKERAERRKERLIYVGISLENIITPSVEEEQEKPEIIIKEKKETKRSKSWGRRSTRTKKSISYRFDEFDEAIEEAIEEDIKEAEGGGAGRGKDMANITGHRGKDMSVILQADEGKENGRPPRPSAGQRRKKRRRLNDLDSDSTVDEEESEDEFRISESSEEEFVVSENDTDGEFEVDYNDSDFGSNSSRHRTSSRPRKAPKQRRSSRKRRRPRGYSDDEEEETDEEDEDEIATEGSSEYSDSDLDMSRRRSRRSLKKQVNYCETSESEGSQAETNRAKMKPRHRQDSSDSEASFSRDSEEESRDRRVKRKADSSEEDSRQRRRRLALKRRRASEDDDSDDDSDESSEEDRPVRKRVNRIDSDDDDEEQEEKPKENKAAEKEDEESKGTNPVVCNPVALPPTNGQSPIKSLEGLVSKPAAATPGLTPHLEPPKNISATPAAAIAPNGLVGQEMAAQEEDEDDLLGVTDLVDYVCNNEDL
ncbi:hypothetical protein PFLUV_G00188640 [Perca fluviatilis]|uniref:PHD-type domain-containing protein n=1 Tax=Perca fluviatilis TaxID=8168 RepID=A0A6A5EQX1_PERFL|nr:remodeling and spacing factor 1 [Perca fluviatilis]KAF1378254.1 hypothetical protein PFLUV_G00188640 [Perca fluviatilis]